MKKVFFIAYYFPPLGMGGVQRSVKFVRYLPQFGWNPIVLTVKDVTYFAKDPSLLDEIPNQRIYRTESLDPLRIYWKLNITSPKTSTNSDKSKGNILVKFLHTLSRHIFFPDAKVLWLPFLIPKAIQILHQEKVDCIFTTSPPISSHIAGWILTKITGIPWVADFRDSLVTPGKDFKNACNTYFFKRILQSAKKIITVSDPIQEEIQTVTQKWDKNFQIILNGFDENDFKNQQSVKKSSTFTCTYCGTLSPFLNPEPFFQGLSLALNQNPDLKKNIKLNLIGNITNLNIDVLLEENNLKKATQVFGYYPHLKSIAEMQCADLLILILPSNVGSGMVTGKLFEYLASNKPILAIAPPCVATRIITDLKRGCIVHPENIKVISQAILRYYENWKNNDNELPLISSEKLKPFNRYYQTKQLSRVFDAAL